MGDVDKIEANDGATGVLIRATVGEAIALAIDRHRAGHLAAAEVVYRDVLAVDGNQPDALHFLGVLRHQAGRGEAALELIRRAIAICPTYVDAYNNLGNVYETMGDLEQARQAYERVIELNPNHAGAHNNLGVVLKDLGQSDAALAAYEKARALDPDNADVYLNLGNTYRQQRQFLLGGPVLPQGDRPQALPCRGLPGAGGDALRDEGLRRGQGAAPAVAGLRSRQCPCPPSSGGAHRRRHPRAGVRRLRARDLRWFCPELRQGVARHRLPRAATGGRSAGRGGAVGFGCAGGARCRLWHRAVRERAATAGGDADRRRSVLGHAGPGAQPKPLRRTERSRADRLSRRRRPDLRSDRLG